MQIAVTGSTGLIGSALVSLLKAKGQSVRRLVRDQRLAGTDQVFWDPVAGKLDPALLTGTEAIVHLAGENIVGRWTARKKVRIRDSRVNGTRLLADALARMESPPRILLSASAIGFYGNRGDELITEQAEAGSGFLPEVCREWEAATGPAAGRGIRVASLRFGVVLSPAGGALAKMLPPFRMGLGGRLGNGAQYMSWITLDDAVEAIHHTLVTDSLTGPVNLVSPGSVTNRDFTRILARVLRRPALLPMPAAAARLLFGEMAEALLLGGARVDPARLRASSFPFRHPELDGALRELLGRT